MKIYNSKHHELSGSSLSEVIKEARFEYHIIQKRSPRRVPYVKSKYFTKDKIFINNFWIHLNQKSPNERIRRLRFYTCAIDLLRNSSYTPITIGTNVNMDISLHRFYGQSKDGSYYCVQVKENKRNNRKEFISVFPIKKPSN